MHRIARPALSAAVAFAFALYGLDAVAQAAAKGDVTIYRCTDARGHLSLQDSPCAKGDTQRTQQMIRPIDPPPRSKPAEPAISPSAPAQPETRTIVLRTAQPMYECVRDDNTTYTSDSGEGDPRFVQDYGYGYPAFVGGGLQGGRSDVGRGSDARSRPPPRAAGVGTATPTAPAGSGAMQPRPSFVTRDNPPSPPSRPRPDRPPLGGGVLYGYGGGGGYWTRDPCHALPQAEVCDRSRDRRDAIRTRFFNAQPSEREQLSKEERGINARLAADCGGSG